MTILLTILLVIGRVLLVVLLLLLLLILLLLFVPFRYRFDGQKDGGRLEGSGTISYLLSAVRARITLKKEAQGTLHREVDLILFGVSRNDRKRKQKERLRAKREQEKRKRFEELKAKDPKHYEELKQEAQRRRAKSREAETEAAVQKPTPVPQQVPDPKKHRMPSGVNQPKHTVVRPLIRLFALLLDLLHRGITALILLPIRLISNAFALADRIRELQDAMRSMREFLTDPRLWRALKLTKNEVKKLLSHLRPRTLTGEIAYGFEDPSVTGQVLAAASLFYPLYGPEFVLRPDFEAEERFADGDIHFSGRIYLGYLLYLAVTLLLNRNIRFVISYIRGRNNKEEETNG